MSSLDSPDSVEVVALLRRKKRKLEKLGDVNPTMEVLPAEGTSKGVSQEERALVIVPAEGSLQSGNRGELAAGLPGGSETGGARG